jgi:hypothetical protein
MYGVSRCLAEIDRRRDSGKGWLPFSRTIHEAIAAMDFFTVPDGDLPRALLLLRDQPQRRRILHFNFNATEHPCCPQ